MANHPKYWWNYKELADYAGLVYMEAELALTGLDRAGLLRHKRGEDKRRKPGVRLRKKRIIQLWLEFPAQESGPGIGLV